jgi:hypothetical protein
MQRDTVGRRDVRPTVACRRRPQESVAYHAPVFDAERTPQLTPPDSDGPGAPGRHGLLRSPVRVIILIWLSWAVIMLGFQEFVTARTRIVGPDNALIWTPSMTSPGALDAYPYLLDPTLAAHVAWDSNYYISIAIAGYDDPTAVYYKGADGISRVSVNYTFMPLYPLAMSLVAAPLSVLGVEPLPAAIIAGVLISLVATLFVMLGMYGIARPILGEATAIRAAFYLLIFPSGFFLAQVYTEALFLALALGSMALAAAKRPLAAAAVAALATWTRPIGFLLVFPLFIGLVAQLRSQRDRGPSDSVLQDLRELAMRWLAPRRIAEDLRPAWRWLVAAASPVVAYLVWSAIYGERFHLIEGYFGRGLLSLDRFWTTWTTELLNISDYGRESQAYLILEFGAAALSIAACIWAIRRWPGVALFGLAAILLPITSGAPQGVIRFALTVPAIFLLLARLGENQLFDRAWVVLSVLLMGFLTTLFSFNLWVG